MVELNDLFKHVSLLTIKGKALGPWCIRFLLHLFTYGRYTQRGGELGQDMITKWVELALGDGIAGGFMTAMIAMYIESRVPLPAWDISQCYVEKTS
jgi:hypothetical protein